MKAGSLSSSRETLQPGSFFAAMWMWMSITGGGGATLAPAAGSLSGAGVPRITRFTRAAATIPVPPGDARQDACAVSSELRGDRLRHVQRRGGPTRVVGSHLALGDHRGDRALELLGHGRLAEPVHHHLGGQDRGAGGDLVLAGGLG